MSLLLIGIGWSASAYLLGRSFALPGPSTRATLDLCSVLFSSSCDRALADERYWILNVPLAGWGVIYFSTLSGLLLLARFVKGTFEAHALIAGSILALAGIGVGLALSMSALVGRSPMCPMCLAVHVVNVALLFTLQRTIGRPLSEQLRIVRNSSSRLLRPGAVAAESSRWQLVGFAAVALLAAMAYQWVYVESALRRPAAMHRPDRAEIIAAYQASSETTLPVSGDDAHDGPLTAPVRLVVFESFRCLHCRHLAAGLSALRREFGDQVLVVFKHYPLSSQCNDRLSRDLQPGACELAWAAEAARRQGRFWQLHDVLLATDSLATAADMARWAREAGLDSERFEADRRSSSVRERVAADVALGNRLELPGTPSAYLNGRRVPSATAEHLELLVRHELGRKAAGSAHGGPAAGEPGRLRRGSRPSGGG